MPGFVLTSRAEAPVEDVWKLLHDPTRFPEWWAGVETVQTGSDGEYTIWPVGYPDFPMPQRLGTNRPDSRVTISCLVSDLEFVWQLHTDGEATEIEVRVTLPEREAHRLDTERGRIAESITRLAALAATGADR